MELFNKTWEDKLTKSNKEEDKSCLCHNESEYEAMTTKSDIRKSILNIYSHNMVNMGMTKNTCLEIKYCPFCGKRLK